MKVLEFPNSLLHANHGQINLHYHTRQIPMQQPLALQEIGTSSTPGSKYKTWKRKYNGQRKKRQRETKTEWISRLLFLTREGEDYFALQWVPHPVSRAPSRLIKTGIISYGEQ